MSAAKKKCCTSWKVSLRTPPSKTSSTSYVRQKIDHGLEDVEAGRTLSEEEFDQRMAKWLEP